MQILRLLMAKRETLSGLAQSLGKSPAWVKHHVQRLAGANLVELVEVRRTGKIREKFYRASASIYLLQEIVLPSSEKPTLVFSGSHDLALEEIGTQIAGHATLLSLPVGSLDGLANLRQGLCQISGTHLLDTSGEYNTPFIRHFFPDRAMQVFTLAYRTQGLMLPPGNPWGIKGLPDLARANLHFINRNPGSGTRLWLDQELGRLGIPPETISGYERSASTHTACAQAVQIEEVDAALGLQAAAQKYGLDFIPLFEERYDLVLPDEHDRVLAPLLDHIQGETFRRSLSQLTGYSTTHSGEQIPL
jgi:putative molybdopterin biosynthesis protein